MDSIDVSSNARPSHVADAPGMDHAASLAAQDEFTRLDRAESFRLLRTAVGTTVARKVHDMIVAFEADDLDPATSSGWSVTVTGRAALVTDSSTIARYQAVPLVPWAPGVRDQFVTITTEMVEGLRVRGPLDS